MRAGRKSKHAASARWRCLAIFESLRHGDIKWFRRQSVTPPCLTPFPCTFSANIAKRDCGDLRSLPLEFPSERITVRELIRERVYQEVQDFNHKPDGPRTEYRLKKHREIQRKPQFEKAVEAFNRNGFLVLIDDKQAESLDEEFVIGRGSPQ